MASAPEGRGTAEALEGGATVVWHDDLKAGEGSLRFGLGAGGELLLRWPGSPSYGPGATSPEELAAAAHSACFTMTLADTLVRRRHPAQIAVEARTTFGLADGVRLIRRSQLEIAVDADGPSEEELEHATMSIERKTSPEELVAGAHDISVDAKLDAA